MSAHRPPRMPRARGDRLRGGLRPDGRRLTLATLVATAVSIAVIFSLPELNWVTGPRGSRWVGLAVLFTLVTSGAYLLEAVLTVLVLRSLPRPDLLTAVRLTRMRNSYLFFRLAGGSGTALSFSVTLLLLAGVVLLLLIMRPASVPLWLLLILGVLAVLAAWVATTVRYACEYAAIDARGDSFEMLATPGRERSFEEYAHMAVLVQTSAAPSDVLPLDRPARRAMRTQSVLAFLMNSVIIAVGTSAILTVLGAG